MTPMVYTRKLWADGADEFTAFDEAPRKIDLYEWFHLSAHVRATYLLQNTRRVKIRELSSFHAKIDIDGSDSDDDIEMVEPGPAANASHVTPLLKDGKGAKGKGKGQPYQPDVKTVIKFHAFADLSTHDSYENHEHRSPHGQKTHKWARIRVGVRVGARGKVLGKTRSDELILRFLWDDDCEETITILSRDAANAQKGSFIFLHVDPQFVVEDNEDWNDLEKYIGLAEGPYSSQWIHGSVYASVGAVGVS